MNKFKPLLAYTLERKDWDKLKFPVMVSYKVDGLRAVVIDGVVYSRSMKPIRSKTVQKLFGKSEYNGLDGELIYGSPTEHDCFNKSTSFCMSADIPQGMDESQVSFFVFDRFDIEGGYSERYSQIPNYIQGQVKKLGNLIVHNKEQMASFESEALSQGWEGLIIRSLDGRYKQGRSTFKEGIIGKAKEFLDEEAVIIGFEEKLHNENVATINELGYTERSSAKDGMVGADTLGALMVSSQKWGAFKIGTGFNDEQRKEIWLNKDKYLGKLAKFKYFAIQSGYNKPRFPVWLGIRSEEDM